MVKDDEGNGKFSLFDIWFHIGVGINLVVVFLLLWYALG
jgi:hypothetical protein